MIGIYKITNLITKQSYIGQSNNIERRWKEHCRPSKANKSLISDAINSFGKENFSFQILQECKIEELDSYEEFYIKKYNTINPNGYNVESSVNGNSRNYSGYSEEIISNIIFDIKNSSLSLTEIADKYSVNKSTITRINKGDVHRRENESYPLREKIKKERVEKYSKCPDRDTLKALIYDKTFCDIGREYGVSDNAVRKWCDKYSLPRTKKEIKSLSQDEWDKI